MGLQDIPPGAWKGAGLDGKDLGADMDLLKATEACSRGGDPTSQACLVAHGSVGQVPLSPQNLRIARKEPK